MEEGIQPAEELRSHERYVEELSSPDDYWMTITDAARVTRRQDITLRRWIASGELPVRKDRVGLNRRARQVRASDVAKLTPIIDTSAMISGEEARINLISIPSEQKAIRADHQHLLADVSALRALLAEQGQATERALTEQRESWQRELKSVREHYNQQLVLQQQAIEVHQQSLERIHADLLARLVQHAESAQQQQQELQTLQEALLTQKNTFQEALQDQHQALEALIAQQRDWMHQGIATLQAALAETNQGIARSAEAFTARLEQVAQAGSNQARQQEQKIQRVEASFQREQESLAQRVALLASQLTEYQSQHEHSLQQTEARLAHDQQARAHLQHEQAALAQQITTLAARFAEQQSRHEQARLLAEERLAALRKQLAALEQQVSANVQTSQQPTSAKVEASQ